ncbi:MAG: SCO family protein [Myxococcales bacterium]|nr:SCO family protein [Myxococcales bacterium]
MRGFYFVHVATGVILIAVLVAFFGLRNEWGGRSGVVDIVSAPGTAPVSSLPSRGDPKPLTFTNHLGETVSELDFRGGHSLVFFGYSSCPDVCPGNLMVMSRALTTLGEAAEQVRPIFISFDPERDTPEVLNSYVSHFHPRLIGLTGTPAEIEAATRAYGVFFERSENSDGSAGSGEIQHTSNTFLIGPDGQALAIFRHNTPPDEMAAVILEKIQQSQDQNTAALP